jgi:hypothetical protein
MTKELAWLALALAVVLGGGAAVALAHGAVIPLASVELVAAALLVVPRTRRVGAIAMLGVLAAASILHASFGEVPPTSFVVDAVALVIVARGARGAR